MRDKSCKKAVSGRFIETGVGCKRLQNKCSTDKEYQSVQLIKQEEFRVRVLVGRVRVTFSALGEGVGVCDHRPVVQDMDVGIHDSVDHQSRHGNDQQDRECPF